MATNNAHKEMPGSGVMYWEEEEMRKSPKAQTSKALSFLNAITRQVRSSRLLHGKSLPAVVTTCLL